MLASISMAAFLAGCGSDEVAKQVFTETVVTINELQSRNSSIESDTSKKSDWAELYNPSDANVSLEGFFISDDRNTPTKAKLPAEAVVHAQGFLVLWLDDTTGDATHPLHFPFKLSGDGDHFVLSNPNGHIVQAVTLPDDPTGTDTTLPDVSYGAYPDGSINFGWCAKPTQGDPNEADCVDAGT